MSGRIVREVMDFAPEDLTPAELLVFLALAEEARTETRSVCEPAESLSRRARVSLSMVYKAQSALASRGLIVPFYKDKLGRPHVNVGRTQRYTITRLKPEHRAATIREHSRVGRHKASSAGMQSPVDNVLASVESLPSRRESLPTRAREPSCTGMPPRNTSVKPPWVESLETQSVSVGAAS